MSRVCVEDGAPATDSTTHQDSANPPPASQRLQDVFQERAETFASPSSPTRAVASIATAELETNIHDNTVASLGDNRTRSTLTTLRPSALLEDEIMAQFEEAAVQDTLAAARSDDETLAIRLDAYYRSEERISTPFASHHPSEENGVIAECMRHDLSVIPPLAAATNWCEGDGGAAVASNDREVAPLPCNFASAYAETETASILEDSNAAGGDEYLAAAIAAQDQELMAMKRAAAYGIDDTVASVLSVTEDVHPSEPNDGVQAEFVGQDISGSVQPPPPSLPPGRGFSSALPETSTSSAATMVMEQDDTVEEAVVIDSEPVHKGLQTPREAQVLPVLEDADASNASKSSGRVRRRGSQRRSRQRWGEITEIQELPDLHPLERDELNAQASTEALLVGADDSYAVAVPQQTQNLGYQATRNAPQARAVVANQSGTTEHESTVATAIMPEPPPETEDSDFGVAHVMMEDPNVLLEHHLDRKPSARASRSNRRSDQRNSLTMISETASMSDQEEQSASTSVSYAPGSHEARSGNTEATLATPDSSGVATGRQWLASPAAPVGMAHQDRVNAHELAVLTQHQSQVEIVDIREASDIHPAEYEEETHEHAEYFGPSSLNGLSPAPLPSTRAHVVEHGTPEAATNGVLQCFAAVPSGSVQGVRDASIAQYTSASAVPIEQSDHRTDYAASYGSGVPVEAASQFDSISVAPSPVQAAESIGTIDGGATAHVVAIQEEEDVHPEERGPGGNVADFIGTAIAAEVVDTSRELAQPIMAVPPVAFGGTREVSDAEATLVDGGVVGSLNLSERLPLAPTLETATVLPEYDHIGTVKQDSSVCECSGGGATAPVSVPPVEAVDATSNDLSYSSSDQADDIRYLQRRDREYHQNIASSIGGIIGDQAGETFTNALIGPTVVSNIPTRQNGINHHHSFSPSSGTQEDVARSASLNSQGFDNATSQTFALRRSNSADNLAVMSAVPRALLPWSVVQNPRSGLWIATLQTNQRALENNEVANASKSLRVFSMPSEKQALALARAWTPPRMHTFRDQKRCHICSNKFGPFRRSCHCRNCGVVVCLKDCANQWPAKMIPETYNIKKEFYPNVCKSCNWLCNAFRKALMEGDRDKAMAVYSTGNLNLYTPFANVKGELFYPVHCAVLGDNLDLLRFLVDEHCCPIKSVRVSSGRSSHSYTPIVTGKGRSLLGIAMENENLEIARYLVVEKGVNVASEPDITRELLCKNFVKVLQFLPSSLVPAEEPLPQIAQEPDDYIEAMPSRLPQERIPQEDPRRSISQEARDFGAVAMNSDAQNNNEECIICFDNPINCVASPCMHQMCCMRCSENINGRCPVCSSECTFLRVFRP